MTHQLKKDQVRCLQTSKSWSPHLDKAVQSYCIEDIRTSQIIAKPSTKESSIGPLGQVREQNTFSKVKSRITI